MVYVLFELFILLILILLGIAVFNKFKYLSYIFGAISFWVLTILLTDIHYLIGFNYSLALVSSRLSFLGGILIFPFIIMFIFNIRGSFLYDKKNLKKVILVVTSVFDVVMGFIALGPWVVEGLEFQDGNLFSISGSFYNYFVIAISAFYIFLVIIILIQMFRSTNKLIKQRFQYILGGTVTSILWVLVTNAIIPALGIAEIRVLGPIGLIFMLVFSSYALYSNRLLRFRRIIERIFYHFLLWVFVYSLIIMVSFIQDFYWESRLYKDFYIGNVLIAFILSFICYYTPIILRKFLIRVGLYYKDPVEMRENLLKDLSMELNLSEITSQTLSVFDKVFQIKVASISLINEDRDIVFAEGNFKNDSLSKVDSKSISIILKYLKEGLDGKMSPITLSELNIIKTYGKEEERVRRFMDDNEIELIFPFYGKTEIMGLLFLGEKGNRKAYTVGDMEFLKSIIGFLSASFGRALLYQEVEKFNRTLKQKVEKATKELRKKNKRLEEARRKERDMMDIMGHELRTPASVVKINADMLKMARKRVDKKDKQSCTTFLKQLDKSLPRIKDAIENELRLINILLTSAKMEGNRLELHKNEVDMLKLIDRGVHSQEKDAEKKNLTLAYKKLEEPQEFPTVYADQVRLQEVLYNLINNAVKYTKEGGVTVKPKLTEDGKYVKVSIEDTGVGIPEEEISKLGRKFYRVGQYINQQDEDSSKTKKEEKRPDIVRPGGTGLGLYVTFELIKAHDGKIDIDSEVGKGSTFTFTIPVYDPDKHEKKEEKQIKDVFTRLGLKKK